MAREDTSSEPVKTRPAQPSDIPAITEIYNQGIEERIATFESEPRSVEAMQSWLDEHQGRYLALVAEIDGQVAGWASVGQYRPRECYAGIGEYSIYIHRDFRGRGAGKVLLRALIAAAAEKGYWKLTSRIFVENVA
ncbi:MAG TPA: GNAT family N-acetyltransferase, partial [Thermomicrobiaceae bacterium]|nr:GNAT family N-acetyltransferase [Thermomicrobiaceae bacterium]